MHSDTTLTDRADEPRPKSACALEIEGKKILLKGGWYKLAVVKSEEWLEREPVDDPAMFVDRIRGAAIGADVFSFAQKLPNTEPRFRYVKEWENVAAIRLTTFEKWWEGDLPQVTRKNVRRAQKRGVVVREDTFDDTFVRGIISVHNDTPIRQGTAFSHYGKEEDQVRADYSSYLDRSLFLGAYVGEEMVGFCKVVFQGKVASILNILTKTAHSDKRPANALIAKLVEMCVERGIAFVTYGKYTYGNKTDSPLTEFKRRNGFESIPVPRYYVPLSLLGRLVVATRLHRGLIGILPGRLITLFVSVRGWINRRRAGVAVRAETSGKGAAKGERNEEDERAEA